MNSLIPTKTAILTPTILAHCPRCLSVEVETTTPIANATVREAAETVWHDCWAGHKGAAARFLLRWLCVNAANGLIADTCRCRHCGWNFREQSSGHREEVRS